MKKYLSILPVLAIFMAIMMFYFNKNSVIHERENELRDLKELSLEVNSLYKNFILDLKSLNHNINADAVSSSYRDFQISLENYIKHLSSLDYDRLYRLSNIMKKKNIALSSAYEDIKTDSARLKISMLWASVHFKNYLKHHNRLSGGDKKYIDNLFKSVLNSSTNNSITLKYISGLKYTDDLNRQLRAIQEKQVDLIHLNEEIAKNDITTEISEVVLFTFEQSNTLRQETNEMIKNLLMIVGVLLVLALGVYVKEVKEAEELKRVKHDLNEFVDALDEGAIVSKSDLTGAIISVNDKFCEISGYERDELIGKQHNIIRHPDMKDEVFRNLWSTIKKGEIFRGTIKNRAKDGSAYYVATTVIPMHNEDGVVDTYLSVRYDITGFINPITNNI
jgi:PAS domain S-box-containing protein